MFCLPILFHLSRHTFATTVYLCNGGTIEALSKILGHKHISTTQIYAEVTNRMVSSDFRAISGNLAAMQRSVLEKKDRKQDGKRVRRSRCTPPCVYVGLFPRLRFGRMST